MLIDVFFIYIYIYNNDLHKKVKKKHSTVPQQYSVLMGENKMLKI